MHNLCEYYDQDNAERMPVATFESELVLFLLADPPRLAFTCILRHFTCTPYT
jgi:hypothetical protein